MRSREITDVLIIGAGVSGAAQFYALAKYSNVSRVALLEKEARAGCINSRATSNSQTLHEGDIETNYSFEKAQAVQHKASFTRAYVKQKKSPELSLMGPKMVLGVGQKEVAFLKERFKQFATLYPTLELLQGAVLKEKEPALFKDRKAEEELVALYNPDGLTINYGLLARHLVSDALESTKEDANKNYEALFETGVERIEREGDHFEVSTTMGVIYARFVSVCAGAHSLYFAKKMELDEVKHLSLLCVAGNFYYTPKYIQSKIYTVQNPKLPFSAVHGDPDILDTEGERTRFGPTTRIVFMLERHRYQTILDYLFVVPPLWGSFVSLFKILFDKDFFFYAIRHNILFQIPLLGNYLFVKEARKIIPSLKYKELSRAKGQGGVRPQIVNTKKENPLDLGEAKLRGEKIIFNVTPSPGATTCVYNGLTDAEHIAQELNAQYDSSKIERDFGRKL